MAQLKQPKPSPKPELQLKPKQWPLTEKDVCQEPRLYRIHRLNAFEWQALVVEHGIEYPIGKPDLFDIVKNRVASCMRAEGQVDFIQAKLNSGAPKLAQ